VLRGESEKILSVIAVEISAFTNDVVIEGHTDSRPYTANGRQYTNWELSSDRAHAARRVMLAGGLRADQISAVRGFADRELRVPEDSTDPRNRRVSIVVRSPSAREFEVSLRERQTMAAATAGAAASVPVPAPAVTQP
jgi:chemotaxis protein MotB